MSELVEARLNLRVPRDGRGDLQDAVAERLRRAAAVDRVESFDVTGVRPGLNDLTLRVRTTVACDIDADSEAATALMEAVGIEAVDAEFVDHPDDEADPGSEDEP
ncbi:hypothetical protein [Salinigranum marinum]|uniref:hypothetical protein n=1 Tax=Salinigranum marinum TaxID=1515595 RepID=UPI002989FE0F|nr:hypothetical protein [Salinigranum marinum]